MPKLLIQLLHVDFKILRRDQQVFELDGPDEAGFFPNWHKLTAANFALLETPIHLVTDFDSRRLTNILWEGSLPFSSDYGCTHFGATFALSQQLFKSVVGWPNGQGLSGLVRRVGLNG
jgi:hypothetical protein